MYNFDQFINMYEIGIDLLIKIFRTQTDITKLSALWIDFTYFIKINNMKIFPNNKLKEYFIRDI